MPGYESAVVRLLTGGGATAGLGVLMGRNAVVTCAHVLNTALGRPQREQATPKATVLVEFPLATGGAVRRATLGAWTPPALAGAGGDVAGLVLHEEAPRSATPARFSTQAGAPGERLRVFGYPGTPPRSDGAWVDLEFKGEVGNRLIQVESRGDQTIKAQAGYSGSPVWSDRTGLVVGLLHATAFADEPERDAYLIPPSAVAETWREEFDYLPAPSDAGPGPEPSTTEHAEASLGHGVQSDQANKRAWGEAVVGARPDRYGEPDGSAAIAVPNYLNFDLRIDSSGLGGLQAQVLNSPAGKSHLIPLAAPPLDSETGDFLDKIGQQYRARSGKSTSPETSTLRVFGQRLFDWVFSGPLGTTLATSIDVVERQDFGLRIRLLLDHCPELWNVPWECLYSDDAHRFLALSKWTPIVRYFELPGHLRSLVVPPPLRMLVWAPSPIDFTAVDWESEWQALLDSLSNPRRSGRVEVERVSTGTLAELRRHLRRRDYHVLHYIGHSAYISEEEEGVLALEGPNGRSQWIGAADLGAVLYDHRSLRLVLLNSGESARAARTNPYSGIAQALIREGVPAVVGMQSQISDQTAVIFSRSFHEALADGYPVDAAMTEARNAIREQSGPVEWVVPVLNMSTPDGRIFQPADSMPTGPGSP